MRMELSSISGQLFALVISSLGSNRVKCKVPAPLAKYSTLLVLEIGEDGC